MNLLEYLLQARLMGADGQGGGQGGGGQGPWTTAGIAQGLEPSGSIVIQQSPIAAYAFSHKPITTLTVRNQGSFSIGVRCFEVSGLTKLSWHQSSPVEGSYLFAGCEGLLRAVMDCTGSLSNAFPDCVALEVLDLGPQLQGLTNLCLRNCGSLRTLVLRRTEGPIALGSVNGVAGTPLALGGAGASIYIPRVLYDHLGDGSALDYRAATNWTVLDGAGTIQWLCLEGSSYEAQWADGEEVEA